MNDRYFAVDPLLYNKLAILAKIHHYTTVEEYVENILETWALASEVGLKYRNKKL